MIAKIGMTIVMLLMIGITVFSYIGTTYQPELAVFLFANVLMTIFCGKAWLSEMTEK